MNNKGFTLVEVLAVIVILAVLGGIATYGVINAIKVSKDKAEDAFLNQIGKQIEMYIDLNSFTKSGEEIPFSKKRGEKRDSETNSYIYYSEDTAWEFQEGGKRLTLGDLVSEGYIDKNEIENPNNNKECNINNEIIIFRDTDSVYYYYVDFNDDGSEEDCVVNGKIINTLPKELICVLPNEYSFIKQAFEYNNPDDKCTE